MKIIAAQLDLARQKESVSFIKEYVDFVCKNGYNTVFLYLEASVRTSITPFFDEAQSYSMEEMKEIVDYIESRNMQAVPAFENLYHMEKFLQYDELAHLSEYTDANEEGRGWAPAHYPRGSVACVSNPAVNEFMDAYMAEVCTLFKGEYIHMGLDEIFEFAECPRCKERLSNGESKQNMYLRHVLHCYDFVKKLGKRMMMWSDFFEYFNIVEELPRDIILCHWEYNFVGEEPRGHWTNRVKRDWLRIFEELGFAYMVCFWTTSAATLLNVETLSNYADKFKPLGKLMTTWERESRFYFGNYPCIAYCGRRWSGKIGDSYEEKVGVYAEYFGGNSEFAKIILAIQVREGYSAYLNVAKMAETPYVSRYLYNKAYYYLLERLGDELQKIQGDKKIAALAYNFLAEQKVFMQVVELGNIIFDGYERGNVNIPQVYEQLDAFAKEFERIKTFEAQVWQECRPDIASNHNAFERRWRGNFAMIDKIREGLEDNVGIVYLDLMVPDCYNTVKGELLVKYQGEEEYARLYKGAIKPSVAIFESCGCYGFRFAMKNERVESIVFNVFGEGAVYPLHIQVLTNGKKYHPREVQKLYGEVENEEKLLSSDTTFACMGYEKGIDHLNDVGLSKKYSGVKLTF